MWKQVPGFPMYEVSDNGVVRIAARKKCHLKRRKPGDVIRAYVKNQYLQVVLWNDHKKYYRNIHRLVATAFLPNPNDYPQVNHKDENKLNNSVSNLEWCTAVYNVNYGTGIARRVKGHTRTGSPKAEQPVRQIKDGVVIGEYESIASAARACGIPESGIRRNLYGKSHTCHGCVWERVK